MTKPLTARAKEVLLNYLEGRHPLKRWDGTKYVGTRGMGGSGLRLLGRLRDGGYLGWTGGWTGASYFLNDAGRAVAERYQEITASKRAPK